jgi:hypothetical protein
VCESYKERVYPACRKKADVSPLSPPADSIRLGNEKILQLWQVSFQVLAVLDLSSAAFFRLLRGGLGGQTSEQCWIFFITGHAELNFEHCSISL